MSEKGHRLSYTHSLCAALNCWGFYIYNDDFYLLWQRGTNEDLPQLEWKQFHTCPFKCAFVVGCLLLSSLRWGCRGVWVWKDFSAQSVTPHLAAPSSGFPALLSCRYLSGARAKESVGLRW